MSTAPPTVGPIPRNVADPAPLFLGGALAHIGHARLPRALAGRVPLLLLLLAIPLLLWLDPAAAAITLGAAAGSLFLVSTLYLIWYARFVNTNTRNTTLCPQCLSRMWQLCCARCREPVPHLALMWRGTFLAECPHCRLRLSCRRETLLAWCSTCAHTEPRPDLFYRKPTHLMVWATDRMPEPSQVAGDWRVVESAGGGPMVLYHAPDEHSASVLYLVDPLADERFDPYVIEKDRMLLVSEGVSEEIADRWRARFSAALYERI